MKFEEITSAVTKRVGNKIFINCKAGDKIIHFQEEIFVLTEWWLQECTSQCLAGKTEKSLCYCKFTIKIYVHVYY